MFRNGGIVPGMIPVRLILPLAQKLLAEDESSASVRAADGRGPLFWAHEAGNEEAVELLKVLESCSNNNRSIYDSDEPQAAGAQEDWTDADGKTCKEFEHGKMTEYMVKYES